MAHIDFNLELDYPEYTGARLNKDLRKNLLKIRPKSDAMFEGSEHRNRFFVYTEIAGILGNEKVFYGPTLPHYNSMPDIVFSVNENGQALDLPKKFVKQLNDLTDLVRTPDLHESGFKWYCLILVKWQHVDQGGDLLGEMNFKAKQLMKLGYHVRIIQPKNVLRWTQQGKMDKTDISFIINAMDQTKYLQK